MSIAGVSPIRGAMDRPRPGGTTLVIMVTPEPGKYARAQFPSPFCKLTATEIWRERDESYYCVVPICCTDLWRIKNIQTKQQLIHFKVQCSIKF